MSEWNDDRFDDLSDRVDRIETKLDNGFNRLEKKMDEGFGRMDAKFSAIDTRFDSIYQLMLRICLSLLLGVLGLLGVLVGVVATQA